MATGAHVILLVKVPPPAWGEWGLLFSAAAPDVGSDPFARPEAVDGRPILAVGTATLGHGRHSSLTCGFKDAPVGVESS